MKTTLDIPDDVFRQAKALAAFRGISLRAYVTEALEEKVSSPCSGDVPSAEPPWMRGFGELADLKDETRWIESEIAEAFEGLDEEDRT